MEQKAFKINSPFQPMGDQPQAIEELVAGVDAGKKLQVLLGATGTGKTFTIANVIERTQKPTLVISHNKTLAAQLYEELRELFPENSVSYFVSYYDYFQPEAYIPQRDIYIEKDASRNADLDRLRLAATSSLMSRSDTIVVASVSCIYGLGSPEEYARQITMLERGMRMDRRTFLLALAKMQYTRNDAAPTRGCYRVRGDVIEVFPAQEEFALRIGLLGDDVERIERIDPLTGELLADERRVFIFPAVHYMMPAERMQTALAGIGSELLARLGELEAQGRILESQRLRMRTRFDLEMLHETGVCPGIENYSRHMEGRAPGSRSSTLMDYFRMIPGRAPNDWLVVVDESHVTLPQIKGMHLGDRARKQTLVEHGFRLPSALDNRPLTFDEWLELLPQAICVSATPAPWELTQTEGCVVEQVLRPTGLVDPPISLRPATSQVPDVVKEAKARAARGERTLVTAITKRLCEDLTSWMHGQGVRVRYLHSDIETLDRLTILRDLRRGEFDVLVGVNLLREGLDLPEVSLVCILDADKQGFLRSTSSLIQTMGRAARNADSLAILYADRVTPEMQAAIDEVERRRARQMEHNRLHGITPRTIHKEIRRGIQEEVAAGRKSRRSPTAAEEFDRDELMHALKEEMLEAAEGLDFEAAAHCRDRIKQLESMPIGTRVPRMPADEAEEGRLGPAPGSPDSRPRQARRRKGK